MVVIIESNVLPHILLIVSPIAFQIVVIAVFISENTSETTSFTVLNKVLMLSNNFDPPPLVKYSFIESQFLTTKTAAPAIAAIAIPIGPVTAVNPAPIKGSIFKSPPKPVSYTHLVFCRL